MMKPRTAIAILILASAFVFFGLRFLPSRKTTAPENVTTPHASEAVPSMPPVSVRLEIPSPELSTTPLVTRAEEAKAVQLVQSFQDAVHRNDPDAIDRYVMEIAGAGAPCVASLRTALMQEKDARSAKNIAYALLRVSTPDAFATMLQAIADTENPETKNGILDILKNGLNNENTGWLVHFALSSGSAVRNATAEVVAGADNPDLLARIVNRASTPGERLAAADLLRHVASPGCAQVLQECAMLQDDALGKAAVSALAAQASEESTKLLLDSFSAYGPAPNPERFQFIVEELHNMLRDNPAEPGLAITIESVMTTSSNSMARSAAAAALSNDSAENKEALTQTFQTALEYETDSQVRLYLEQGIRRIHQGQ